MFSCWYFHGIEWAQLVHKLKISLPDVSELSTISSDFNVSMSVGLNLIGTMSSSTTSPLNRIWPSRTLTVAFKKWDFFNLYNYKNGPGANPIKTFWSQFAHYFMKARSIQSHIKMFPILHKRVSNISSKFPLYDCLLLSI